MTQPDLNDLPEDVRLVDLRFLDQPHMIGTYILLGDEPALVDPGPGSTVANLEAGLAEHGVTLDDIRALLLTHIHLDHAGATGTLVARNPGLRVYVHQRGAPHMIAPERLLASAGRLYGDLMERLWGEFLPVPEGRVVALRGGETLHLGQRRVRVFHTPGHAQHHVTYFDPGSGAAFVGDVAGVRVPGAHDARPATPPPEIDLEAWLVSLDTLRELEPNALLLTHFGPGLEPATHIAGFRERLVRWADTVREGLASGEDELAQVSRLGRLADVELDADGKLQAWYQLITPVEQNWQGLARYWRKRASG